jgi:hypothetical protein
MPLSLCVVRRYVPRAPPRHSPYLHPMSVPECPFFFLLPYQTERITDCHCHPHTSSGDRTSRCAPTSTKPPNGSAPLSYYSLATPRPPNGSTKSLLIILHPSISSFSCRLCTVPPPLFLRPPSSYHFVLHACLTSSSFP